VQRAHGYVLKLERLKVLQATMLAMTPAERRRMAGMNPRRSDIIVAGTAILIAALELLHRDSIVVCERALRDGVVVDYLERNIALARRLGDERLRRLDGVHELAKRFGSDGVHENHVGALALMLFDEFASLHHFEPADRDVLFAAALLHDVGRAVNPSAHHKHGAYIVRNAALSGWRADEIDLIATLVRYHRKALPKPSHPEWAGADAQTNERIEGLGALLRVADGLDARRLGVVTHVEVDAASGAPRLLVHAQQEVQPEIEAARYKSDLFERAFGMPLSIVALPPETFGPGEESGASAPVSDAASISG
jgi:exopolyphosphatase/guanosine-5'-triphosphate,3'-diphosphate pyrophosphatase